MSHFVDFEGDQISIYVLQGEQGGPLMGYRNNNGLRRPELNVSIVKGNTWLASAQLNMGITSGWHDDHDTPHRKHPHNHRYKVSTNNHKSVWSGIKEKHHARGVVKNTWYLTARR